MAQTRDHVLFPGCNRYASCPYALFMHESSSESALRFMLIMSMAPQSHVLDGRLTSTSDWLDVIELEELAGPTAMPALADECALPAIALAHGASNQRPSRGRHRRERRLKGRCAAATDPTTRATTARWFRTGSGADKPFQARPRADIGSLRCERPMHIPHVRARRTASVQ
jgi:hypothetical protein